MGGPSEREYTEKLRRMREKLSKRAKDVRSRYAKIEKMKVEALNEVEKMRSSIDRDLDKVEREIIKSKDLAPESKERLHSEISIFKTEIEERYSQLRTRISETMIPAYA